VNCGILGGRWRSRTSSTSIHRARSKARYSGIEFDMPLAYIWTLRDGKVVHFQSYLDPQQAIAVAGLAE
jgi:ketosteroid isomerase-like protein